jgi:hypothetical protein
MIPRYPIAHYQDLAGTQKEIEVIQRNKPTLIKVDDSLLSDTVVEEKLTQMRSYLTLSEEEANKQFFRAGTKYLEYFWEDKPFGTVMGMGIHHSNASYVQDSLLSMKNKYLWTHGRWDWWF